MDEWRERVQAAVSAEEWSRRVAEADRQAAILERVVERVRQGATQAAAFAAEAPEDHRTTWVARLRRYRACGRDGLIARTVAVRPVKRITPEIVSLVRGIAVGLGDGARSPAVKARLDAATKSTWKRCQCGC